MLRKNESLEETQRYREYVEETNKLWSKIIFNSNTIEDFILFNNEYKERVKQYEGN